MKKTLPPIFVSQNTPIRQAMKVIDSSGLGIAFALTNQKKFAGLITDGDIRKAILSGRDTDESVKTIMNKKPAMIKGSVTQKALEALKARKDIIPSGGSLKVPVLDASGRVKDIVLLYADEQKRVILSKSILALPSYSVGVKKVLIVGGAGYLGSVLSRTLLKNDYKINVLDNLTYGDSGIQKLHAHKNFHFLKGDCGNISDVIEAMKGVDAVIHLAAIVGDPASAVNPEQTLKTNYLATKVLAESAKFNQINKFLFASSCSVYGASKSPDERLTENSPLNPVSLYARTKIKSEEGLLGLADENFAPTIFRFATLYGVSPRMRFDLVINILAAKGIVDRKITIFGGEQFRPFVEISDAARACLAWLKAPLHQVGGEVFNVGSNDQNFRVKEIGMIIRSLIPRVSIEVEKEAGDARDYNVSFDKISRILKFKPRKTVYHAIRDIKRLFEKKQVADFNHAQYSNYKHVFSLHVNR